MKVADQQTVANAVEMKHRLGVINFAEGEFEIRSGWNQNRRICLGVVEVTEGLDRNDVVHSVNRILQVL